MSDATQVAHMAIQRQNSQFETDKRLGIPHLSPHTLRHTFAMRFLQADGDIYVLSKLLGHSSVSITERHDAHVVDADIIGRARQIRLPSPAGAAEGATQSATPAR